MLFGQSVFQSVLDRLETERKETDEADEGRSHHIRGLNAGFAAPVREGVSAGSVRPDQAYVDNLALDPQPVPVAEAPPQDPAADGPETKPEEPPVMPEHLARTSPDDVSRELALSSTDTLQTLSDKRRAFAKANHPDGVAAPFRENATLRMKIANLLIDEAVRRLSPPRPVRRPQRPSPR